MVYEERVVALARHIISQYTQWRLRLGSLEAHLEMRIHLQEIQEGGPFRSHSLGGAEAG